MVIRDIVLAFGDYKQEKKTILILTDSDMFIIGKAFREMVITTIEIWLISFSFTTNIVHLFV